LIIVDRVLAVPVVKAKVPVASKINGCNSQYIRKEVLLDGIWCGATRLCVLALDVARVVENVKGDAPNAPAVRVTAVEGRNTDFCAGCAECPIASALVQTKLLVGHHAARVCIGGLARCGCEGHGDAGRNETEEVLERHVDLVVVTGF